MKSEKFASAHKNYAFCMMNYENFSYLRNLKPSFLDIDYDARTKTQHKNHQ